MLWGYNVIKFFVRVSTDLVHEPSPEMWLKINFRNLIIYRCPSLSQSLSPHLPLAAIFATCKAWIFLLLNGSIPYIFLLRVVENVKFKNENSLSPLLRTDTPPFILGIDWATLLHTSSFVEDILPVTFSSSNTRTHFHREKKCRKTFRTSVRATSGLIFLFGVFPLRKEFLDPQIDILLSHQGKLYSFINVFPLEGSEGR